MTVGSWSSSLQWTSAPPGGPYHGITLVVKGDATMLETLMDINKETEWENDYRYGGPMAWYERDRYTDRPGYKLEMDFFHTVIFRDLLSLRDIEDRITYERMLQNAILGTVPKAAATFVGQMRGAYLAQKKLGHVV